MPATLREAALRYGELIARFNKPTAFSDPDQERLRQVSVVKESPLVFEADAVLDYFTRKDFDELRGVENKLIRLYLDHPGAAPRALSLRESPRGYAQKVFVRGNSNILGEDAPGRFLAVLCSADSQPFRKGRGRWDLGASHYHNVGSATSCLRHGQSGVANGIFGRPPGPHAQRFWETRRGAEVIPSYSIIYRDEAHRR